MDRSWGHRISGAARRAAYAVLAVVISSFGPPAFAQFPLGLNLGGPQNHFELSDSVYLDEADSATKTHLERVRIFINNQQWDEAVETLRQVMENQGERVVAVPLPEHISAFYSDLRPPYDLRHFLSLRESCQLQLVSLPAEGLALYRDRVDPQAKKLFTTAKADRDEAGLVRLVDQFFASRWSDDALLMLGELALERGELGRARDCWQRILPPDYWKRAGRAVVEDRDLQEQASKKGREAPKNPALKTARPPWLVYPDSDIPRADVLARLALVSVVEGNTARSRPELLELERDFPQAQGRLGGRDVKFAEMLAGLAQSASEWPRALTSDDWTTFAGSPERTAVPRSNIDAGAVKWIQTLPKCPAVEVNNLSTHRVGETAHDPLSYFPLVVGDLLLVNTQSEILAYDIRTGKPAWGPDPVIYRDEEFGIDRRSTRSALGVPRFTMTAYENRLFVRLGNPVTSNQTEQPVPAAQGYLACLDLAAEGKLVWRTTVWDEKWAFEGAPLADGSRVYVGLRRSDVRPQAHIGCFDAATGELKWRRMVCSADTRGQGQMDEITSNLLTLHEGTLYYNTSLGAVAALEAVNGHVRWITEYPRARSGDLSKGPSHFYRDLTPCVYDQGRLFVAPSDAAPILALDAATGLLLWKADPPLDDNAIHLLGVAGGNLWASGDRLQWMSADGGKRDCWPLSDPSPRSRGRGALVGDKVFWPTAHEIYIFDQRTGEQARQPIELSTRGAPAGDHLQGGNLLVAKGYLFIVTSDKIFALDQRASLGLSADKTKPEAVADPAAGNVPPAKP
jgi:outer membrane protein assembly factor BamB